MEEFKRKFMALSLEKKQSVVKKMRKYIKRYMPAKQYSKTAVGKELHEMFNFAKLNSK